MKNRRNLLAASRAVCAAAVTFGLLTVVPQPALAAPVSCGGVIFQDHDADGTRVENYDFLDAAYSAVPDAGIAGLTVTVTDANGVAVTASTDAAGVWQVTLDDAAFPVRVDIGTVDSAGRTYEAAPIGPDSGTLNQIIETPAGCAGPFDGTGSSGNAGVLIPGNFCENRPELVTSCYLFGNIANHDSQAGVVTLPDGAEDNEAIGGPWQDDPYVVRATLGQVGTVWGVDVDADGTIYSASFVKRHTRLGPTNNPTTIYRIQGTNVVPWIDVDPSAGSPHTAATDSHPTNPAVDGWQLDYGAFAAVGKQGLGDIEVSTDGNTVYTVDLLNRQLVSIPVQANGSAGTPTRTNITAATLGITGCVADDIRPFGLGVDDLGNVMVGTVCSAASTVNAATDLPIPQTGPAAGDSSQLAAWVHRLNGAAFSLVTAVPVPTATRGPQNGVGSPADANYFRGESDWRPWVDVPPFAATFTGWPSGAATYAQPMLSDIQVDGDDLIIGFMDRWAHQAGANAFIEDWSNANGGVPFQLNEPISSGDLVRAESNGAGGFSFPTTGPDFTYTADSYGGSHSETALGGLVQIPGRPYSISASFDPINPGGTWQSGGLEWFDNTTGGHVDGYRLYDGRNDLVVGTFEKAAGIGDVEALCGDPTIEVGNRVWFDTNSDGIQDPAEPSLANVELELLDSGGSVIGTYTTGPDGTYLFAGITSGADHTIGIAQSNYDPGGVFAPGGALEYQGGLTTADAGGDGVDSDAVLVGGLPSIPVNSTVSDHTFDFGLVAQGPLRLGNRVFVDTNNNGVQDGGELGVAEVEVQLWSANPAGAPVAQEGTALTDANGFYVFNDLFAGDYIVAIPDTEVLPGGDLVGHTSSTGNGAAPDADNTPVIDFDDNGDAASGFAAISLPVTLTQGGEPTGESNEGGWVDNNSNLSVDFGFVPVVSLGNLVFHDLDGDGIFNNSDVGIPNVQVQLWTTDGSGNPAGVPITTTTGPAGEYRFPNLLPAEYVVAIDANQQDPLRSLEDFVSTDGNGVAPDPDANPSDNDDNGDPAPGFASIAQAVDLATDNLTLDFGFVAQGPLRVGNRVFLDDNNNGVQDPTENGIADVTVQLWSTDLAGNAAAVIRTTTTDPNGFYMFSDLFDGNYRIAVPNAEIQPGGDLVGHTSSTGNGVAPDGDDVPVIDLDDNGDPSSSLASLTPAFTLAKNTEPTGEVDEDGSWIDDSSNLNIDLGFIELVSVGNLVWSDLDNSGTRDAGEPPLPGVRVELWNNSGPSPVLVGTDFTDTNGNYLFTDLVPGSGYEVRVELLDGSTGNDPAPDPGIDLTDNDDNGGGEVGGFTTSPVFDLFEDNLTVDFGFVPQLDLGNLVFHDLNNNGVFDGTDTGINGVEVDLWTTNPDGSPNAVVATDVTDGSGLYLFPDLAPGDYIVAIDADQQDVGLGLEDFVSTIGNGTAPDPDDDVDNDDNGDPAPGLATITQPISLTADNMTVDMGFVQVLELGNLVWHDLDGNGQADPGEPGLPGVTVQLWATDGAGTPTSVLATTTSGPLGEYSFTDLPPGEYVVAIPDTEQLNLAPLDDFVSTNGNGAAPDPSDGSDNDDNGDPAAGFASVSPPFTLTVDNPNVDFGFVAEGPHRLGNRVFRDTSRNGIQDGVEAGIPGVEVQLWTADASGVPVANVATTTTDPNGFYVFESLFPGEYLAAIPDTEIGIAAPLAGLASTAGNGSAPDPDVATDDLDDNGDPAAGFAAISTAITLAKNTEPAGEVDEDSSWTDSDSNLTVDFGFVGNFRIGNLVWLDFDLNGVADLGEPGVSGVVMQLWSVDPVTGAPVSVLSATSTDSEGRYAFEGLGDGEYIVAIGDDQLLAGGPLAGFESTGSGGAPDPDNGTDNDDNGDPAPGLAAISLPVTLDGNAPTGETDGTSGNPAEGIPAHSTTTPDAASDLTVDFGFSGRYRLGNVVWRDLDGNGVQDAGEPGISGVTVQLWSVDAGGAPLAMLAEQATQGDGSYFFVGLGAADYIVAIPDSMSAAGQPLEGLASTGDAAATDPDDDMDLDDNGDPIAGFSSISSPITLADPEPTAEAGETGGWADAASNLTVDFGFVPGLELGNQIWFDANNNGVLDGTEVGAPGATVALVNSLEVVIATTTTGPNGEYLFSGIRPGTYTVEIPAAEFLPGASLDGWHTTSRGAVSLDPEDDADGDSNGVDTDPATLGGAVRSGPITLVEGAEPANGGTANYSVDFGLYQVALGNEVWFDTNNDGLFDPGESPVAGVTLVLLDGAGNPVIDAAGQPVSTITDAAGTYLFDGLSEGEYIVEVPAAMFVPGAPLENIVSSNGGVFGAVAPDPDNDADRDDNGTPTSVVPLSAVRSLVIELLAGTEPDPVTGLVGSTNATVDFGFTPAASLGSRVWLDVDEDGQQDSNESGVPGVTVQLRRPGSTEVILTVVTDSSGNWSMTGLEPGDYEVQFVDPDRRTFSTANAGSDNALDSDALSTGLTSVVNLSAGESDPFVDAGLIPSGPRLALTGPGLLNRLALSGVTLLAFGWIFLSVSRRQRLKPLPARRD